MQLIDPLYFKTNIALKELAKVFNMRLLFLLLLLEDDVLMFKTCLSVYLQEEQLTLPSALEGLS